MELAPEVLLASSTCVVPEGAVVMFLEESERAGNLRLVYGEFVGWTDLPTNDLALVETIGEADEEG